MPKASGKWGSLRIGERHQANLDAYYNGPRDTTTSHTGNNEPDTYEKGKSNQLRSRGATYKGVKVDDGD
jgi:hypothetical protein